MADISIDQVKRFLLQLQNKICESLQEIDGGADFETDQWQREQGGGGISRVLRNGNIFEQGGVNFSHVFGGQLPVSAICKDTNLGKKLMCLAAIMI